MSLSFMKFHKNSQNRAKLFKSYIYVGLSIGQRIRKWKKEVYISTPKAQFVSLFLGEWWTTDPRRCLKIIVNYKAGEYKSLR